MSDVSAEDKGILVLLPGVNCLAGQETGVTLGRKQDPERFVREGEGMSSKDPIASRVELLEDLLEQIDDFCQLTEPPVAGIRHLSQKSLRVLYQLKKHVEEEKGPVAVEQPSTPLSEPDQWLRYDDVVAEFGIKRAALKTLTERFKVATEVVDGRGTLEYYRPDIIRARQEGAKKRFLRKQASKKQLQSRGFRMSGQEDE
ncbi:MAG: hypothetical protein AAGJ19_22035 [Myxococcota bacterium]